MNSKHARVRAEQVHRTRRPLRARDESWRAGDNGDEGEEGREGR